VQFVNSAAWKRAVQKLGPSLSAAGGQVSVVAQLAQPQARKPSKAFHSPWERELRKMGEPAAIDVALLRMQSLFHS